MAAIDVEWLSIILMSEKLGENGAIILFLGFLGALVAVITMAGGSKACGDWAGNKIKSKKGAQLHLQQHLQALYSETTAHLFQIQQFFHQQVQVVHIWTTCPLKFHIP